MGKFIISLLLTTGIVTYAITGNTRPGQDQTIRKGYRPGVIVVKYLNSAIASQNFQISKDTSGIVKVGINSLDQMHQRLKVFSVSNAELYLPKDERLVKTLGIDRVYLVKVPDTSNIERVAKEYGSDSNVEYATPDWEVYQMVVPNDAYYSKQWGHHNTGQMPSWSWSTYSHTGPLVGTVGFDANAEAAWEHSQGYGSSSITIAIIDGGVEWSHPDLSANIWTNPGESGSGRETNGVDDDGNGYIDDYHGWDFGVGDNNPNDDALGSGHGTCCAGIAAAVANNTIGVAGIAGNCKIMPLKAANASGKLYYSYVNNAIYYAADNGANVISMSLGSSSQDPSNQTACTYAWNKGVVVLAATGNYNKSSISYPAGNSNVIAVGAASPCGDRKRSSSNPSELNLGVSADPNGVTCDNEVWWGSNYGSATQDAADAVDVIAPTIMPTTDRVGSNGYQTGDYELYFNGTSCATPYAAGVCALIFSKYPTWTAQQVRDRLFNTAQDIINVESVAGWDRYTGYGMVDAEAATSDISVTLYQLLDDNITSVGTIGRWNNSNFDTRYTSGQSISVYEGAIEVLQGDQSVYSGQKYNVWERNSSRELDVINHHPFIIQSYDHNFTSQFAPTHPATIQAQLIDGGSPGGYVEFKDPWLIDYPDPLYGNNLRNQGMSAPFKPVAYDPKQPNLGLNTQYKGVFLNQTPDPQNPNAPYYSVRAPQEQMIGSYKG